MVLDIINVKFKYNKDIEINMIGRIVHVGRHPASFSVDEQRRSYLVYIDSKEGPCFEIRGAPKFEIGEDVEYETVRSNQCPSGKKAVKVKFLG